MDTKDSKALSQSDVKSKRADLKRNFTYTLRSIAQAQRNNHNLLRTKTITKEIKITKNNQINQNIFKKAHVVRYLKKSN